jgi:RNA polymerase sigma factor (TIGR02999 family)
MRVDRSFNSLDVLNAIALEHLGTNCCLRSNVWSSFESQDLAATGPFPDIRSETGWYILGGMSDVTRLLNAACDGDSNAAAEILPLVYDELRALANARLAEESPGQTLQATALVHEAYLRLVDVDQVQNWNGRGHFFAAAAEAMRRILVETARRKKRLKRGGDVHRVELADAAAPSADDRLLALDEALTRVVELHHFAGLGHEQVAEALQITLYKARQKWSYAQAWLSDAIGTS